MSARARATSRASPSAARSRPARSAPPPTLGGGARRARRSEQERACALRCVREALPAASDDGLYAHVAARARVDEHLGAAQINHALGDLPRTRARARAVCVRGGERGRA